MNLFEVKYLGNIDLDNLKEFYDSELEFNSLNIEVDVNFTTTKQIDKIYVEPVNNFLNDLEVNNSVILSIIREDFKNNGTTKEYIDIFIDSFEKNEIDELIKHNKQKLSIHEKLLSLIRLKRVGFYPEEEEKCLVICDYVIEDDWSNDLLVICINKNFEVFKITVES